MKAGGRQLDEPDLCSHRFHDNTARELFAQGQAGVANLADEVAMACQEPNDAVFAEADLAEPICYSRRGAELLDSDGESDLDLIEGTKGIAAIDLQRFQPRL